MKPKFLLGLAPLLATIAFVAVPAAAQAATPCFQLTEKGACIAKSYAIVGELKTGTKSKLTSAGGLTVESESFTIEGKAEVGGKSTITASDFDNSTVNLPPPCKAEPKQLSNWTDLLGGTEGKYTDTITVPAGEGEILISGCTGAYEAYNGKHPFEGSVTGSWTNGKPSTLTFSKATGLKLGAEATEFTAAFNITRSTGANIFVSES